MNFSFQEQFELVEEMSTEGNNKASVKGGKIK